MRSIETLARTLRTTAGILLVVVTLAILTVIAGRYAGFPTAWADEVARIAFLWSACLGAASGTYRGLHFAIPLIGANASRRKRQLIESAIALLIIALCALVLWATTSSIPVANLARLPALGVTGAWFHSAVSAFAALTCLFMAVKLVALWRPAS
ncbi:MAG: TRAP transporter small permease [Betaproteobacteria bacterium]